MALATLTAVLTAPSAAAMVPHFNGKIWDPPHTPLGAHTKSVPGKPLGVGGLTAPKYPVPPVAKPSAIPTPKSGSAVVAIGAGARVAATATGGQLVQAGQLPVALAAGAGAAAGSHSVRVEVSDPAAAKAAGVSSSLVTVTDAPGSTDTPTGDVKVNLDLNSLGGQGWADRAKLVSLPACALTTPDKPECRQQTPVAATVNASSGQLTADIKVSAARPGAAATANAAPQAMVLAAVSTPSGASGTYTATSLNPSMSWAAGSNIGNFTYSYPIQLPPALGALAPSVELSYDSSMVDGMTSAQNNQSSWIGDGWGYQAGFIERTYKACMKDGITNSGDLCWGGQNATLSMAGHSGALVRDDATGVWHLQGDDGSKIEQLTGAPNGLPTGEYWRVTTTDGTQYYFGQNHLPGGDGSDPASNAAWKVPVYSPNSGDPCYNSSSGQASNCMMGWRWNLDYVVDPHQNLITYSYATETNNYEQGGGQNNGTGTVATYVRSGYLQQINYGQRLPEQVAAKGTLNAADQVVFGTSERCTPSGAITCDPSQRTTANQSYWPDVPLDQVCASTTSCAQVNPTFFTTKRLTSITTKVLVGSTYSPVDSWALSQSLRDPGDGTPKSLWLDTIVHTGSTGGNSVALPPVTFTPVEKANRVDGLVPAEPPFNRPRIQQITTELGGQVNVVYTTTTDQNHPSCSRVANTMPSSEDGDNLACMPVKWYLPGSSSSTPVADWFNKYLVSSVTEQDAVAKAVSQTTNYTYNGDAAWHRNDAEFTDPATRTWDDFRGYQSVTTTTGSAFPGEAPLTQQTVTYLRGMDGDYKSNGTQRSVSVTSPLGPTVTDSNWLAGTELASQVYNQAGGQVQSMSGTTTNAEQTTATHAQSGGMPPLVARYPGTQATTLTKSLLANGSWRTTTVVATGDPAHGNRVLQSDDQGDGTSAAPEVCTTYNYATSSNPMLLSEVLDDTKVVSGPCGTVANSTNTVSEKRTLYDNQPFGQAGSYGDASSTQVLDHYDSSGNPVFISTGTTGSRDVYGRALSTSSTDGSTYDKNGAQLSGANTQVATTATAYTPATGALPTSIQTTGPTGWVTSQTLDPGRNLTLTSTDANGKVTTKQYDGLGRQTAVWTPDRATNLSAGVAFTYSVNGTTAPSYITTRTLRETLPGSTDYSWKTEIFDGLGRSRQTQTTTPTGDGGRLISDTVYDSHGWVIKTSSPYYDSTTQPNGVIDSPQDSQVPAQTWNTYDGEGRVTNAAFMSFAQPQWSTTTAYPGADRTDVTAPQGGPLTSTFTDARGRTSALWQYHSSTITGNAADADVTTYQYTPDGQPATRTDAAGNTWTYSYDLQGRQTKASDPDTGTLQTFYDANSRIDHTIDARGATLAYSYDLLGRKTGLYNGSVAPANQLASWTYDTLDKGQLSSSTRYVGGANGQAYTSAVTGYDNAYRALGTTVTIPSNEGALAGTYTTTNQYNPVLGTVAKTTYPTHAGLPAETVGYNYSYTGLLTSDGGNDYLVDKVVYDVYGQPLRTTLGAAGAEVVSTQQYDQATGHVINSWVDRQTGTVSADQTTYTYNPSGQITSASDNQDAATTDNQCYTYDYLGRLTNAWTDTQGVTTKPTGTWTDSSGAQFGTGSAVSVPGIGACNNAGGPAKTGTGGLTIGGPAPYWQTYGYDTTGNRTSLVQHDITGNTANDTTTTQTFNAPKTVNTPTSAANTGGGTGGPHALLSTSSTTGSNTAASSYQYDPAGNTTAITSTSGTTTLTWDGEDRLASVTATSQASGTSYLYDADGNQLIRRDPGKTTLELGPDELSLGSDGSLSDVRYYTAPGGMTVARTSTSGNAGTLVYQAADPHGTNAVQITGDATQAVTRRPMDPFGNDRGTQPSTWAGDKGFVGGTLDPATGLTNLGAREYDSVHGRFLNPDPILAAQSPQQWNGYAYSGNDPVNSSDPTGLCPADLCGIGTPIGGTGSSPSNPTRYVSTPGAGVGLGNDVAPSHDDAGGGGGGGGGGGHGGGGKKKSGGVLGFIWGAGKAFGKKVGGTIKGGYELAKTEASDLKGCAWDGDWQTCVNGAKLVWATDPNNPMFLMNAVIGAKDDVQEIYNGYAHGDSAAATGDLLFFGLQFIPGDGSAVKGIEAAGDAEKGLSAAQKAADAAKGIAKGCKNSFPAGTLVLMADGSTKAINTIAVGDKVASADPQTGQRSGETVVQTITTPDDQDFTHLTFTVDPSAGNAAKAVTATVTSTQHHPFWDVTTNRWTNAADLKPGDRIAVDAGTAVVTTVQNYRTDPETAYNLTVEDLHTYYVVVDGTPVLVHNDICPLGYHLPGDPMCRCSEPNGGAKPDSAETPRTGVPWLRPPNMEAPMKWKLEDVNSFVSGMQSAASDLVGHHLEPHDYGGPIDSQFQDPISNFVTTGMQVGVMVWKGGQWIASRR